jgi:DNA-directed RNA polymerase subunit RPC12/RpoP
MKQPDADFPEGFTSEDIFFECPACGKSLGIDEQGAGLVVTCTDCGTKMKVPIPDFSLRNAPEPGTMTMANYTEAEELTGAAASSGNAIDRLKVEIEDMGQRKQQLEQLRLDHLDRFERINEELILIQSAIDRAVDALQGVTKSMPGKNE